MARWQKFAAVCRRPATGPRTLLTERGYAARILCAPVPRPCIRQLVKPFLPILCGPLLLSLVALAQQRQPSLVIQRGHSGDILSIAFDGKKGILASGSSDNSIKLWNVARGKELRTLKGHSSSVNSVAFSPDGKLLASGSTDSTIKIWNVETGEVLRTLAGHSETVSAIAFSPDGAALASGSFDKTVKLWDVATWAETATLRGHGEPVSSVAFRRDSRVLATGSYDGTIKLWEVGAGGQPRTLQDDPYAVKAVAFSPDGETLASGGFDRKIILWDVRSGSKLRTLEGYSGGYGAIAFSPDGRMLAGTYQDLSRDEDTEKIGLWSPSTGKVLATLDANSTMVQAVAFSGDSKTLAAGNFEHTIKVWDVATLKEEGTLKGDARATHSVAFSQDGKTLAVGLWDNSIDLWSMTLGTRLRTLEGGREPVGALAFSPDGRLMASAAPVSFENTHTNVRLWEVTTGRELSPLKGHTASVMSVAFDPTGRFLASGGAHPDSTVRLWDLSTGTARVLKGHTSHVEAVAFSPDGRTLASGGDVTVKLWDVGTGRNLGTFAVSGTSSQRQVRAVAFSPDGRLLAVGVYDGTIRLWDRDKGAELSPLTGHSESVNDVAFSPDGRTLASASTDTTVKLWDVGRWSVRATFTGHTEPVGSIAFSPDGRVLASSATVGLSVILWNTSESDGRELASLVSFDDHRWYAVSPEGHFDTDSLEEARGLHWLIGDAPEDPLALEIFMRDYYRPRLLSLLAAGRPLPKVRPLAALNRTQPLVRIAAVTPAGEGLVEVTVEARNVTSTTQRDQSGRLLESGVYDVRLFRDGRLVGYSSPPTTGGGACSGTAATPADLQEWRRRNCVALSHGVYSKSFKVRLPLHAGPKDVKFTAYAFNEDRVKSETAPPFTHRLKRAQGSRVRTAYVITVGVSANQSGWNLDFADKSAEGMRQSLVSKLSKQYRVADVQLLSTLEADSPRVALKGATKENLRATLDLLAGCPVNDRLRKMVDPLGKLRAATPDDLVVLFISSHGYADPDGTFHLIPYDTGPPAAISEQILNDCLSHPDRTANCEEAIAFLDHSISSDDLAEWWKDVDAGEMVMILDSCHSGAVPGREFKPGPLGDPGFGQLSYDKGMLILTAAQPDKPALATLREGGGRSLLSDALINTSKGDLRIDFPKWLTEAGKRVPEQYKKLYPNVSDEDIQLPVLLNFAKPGRAE